MGTAFLILRRLISEKDFNAIRLVMNENCHIFAKFLSRFDTIRKIQNENLFFYDTKFQYNGFESCILETSTVRSCCLYARDRLAALQQQVNSV